MPHRAQRKNLGIGGGYVLIVGDVVKETRPHSTACLELYEKEEAKKRKRAK
jgi:hypothetical protein